MRWRRPLLYGVLGLAAGVVVVMLLTLVVQTRVLAQRIRSTQQSTVSSVHLIRDCTEPTGSCFKKGQKRTAQAVGGINVHQILVAVCADRPGAQNERQVNRCVLRLTARLAAEQRHRH